MCSISDMSEEEDALVKNFKGLPLDDGESISLKPFRSAEHQEQRPQVEMPKGKKASDVFDAKPVTPPEPGRISPPAEDSSTIQLHESHKDADICVFCSYDDEKNVHKLKEILTRFITLDGGRKLTFFHPEIFGTDCMQWLEDALAYSRFKFIYINKGGVDDEWLKMKHHSALWQKIQRRDQSIVPVKAQRNVPLPSLLGMFRALEVTLLLRGKTLDEVSDVSALSLADIDAYFLQNIHRMFAPLTAAKRVVAAPQPISKAAQVLRESFASLTEQMDPDSGLLPHLYSCGLINSREMESIRAERTSFDKNELILRMLIRRDIGKQEFDKFIKALQNSHQGHIAEKLLQNLSQPPNAKIS